MLSILLTTYVAVLVAELVGDKTLYTVSTMASRYRPAPVMTGVLVAFALKMAAAVLLGRLIARLPVYVVVGLSAATFLGLALALWMKDPEKPEELADAREGFFGPMGVAFGAIFLSEWGDIGQITAATMVARHNQPLVVWLGGTLALATKSVLALTVGIGLRRWVAQRTLRWAGAAMSLLLCVAALLRFDP